MSNIIVTVIASLVSGLIGVFISNRYYKKFEKRKLKTETFRKILGYRGCLTTTVLSQDDINASEFFSALNEVFLIFNEDKEVINSLKKLHKEIKENDKLIDNIVDLIKRMADVLGVDYSNINDSFFERPFTRGS